MTVPGLTGLPAAVSLAGLAAVTWCYAGYPSALYLLDSLRRLLFSHNGRLRSVTGTPPPVSTGPVLRPHRTNGGSPVDAGDEACTVMDARTGQCVSSGVAYPKVSVIFSFVDEPSDMVANRILNILNCGYPYDRLQVLAVSDGPAGDRLAGIRGMVASGSSGHSREVCCELLELPSRRGKTAAQNLAVSRAEGKILVFTDASTVFKEGAIQPLVRALDDPSVGCASGMLVYEGEGAESVYWTVENRIKAMESSLYSLLGANGAIYALRKSDYVYLPDQLQSDLAQPLLLLLMRSRRTIFVPGGMATEHAPDGTSLTFARKRRITLRALRTLPAVVPVLDPFRSPRASAMFFSHKLLRWLCPWLVTLTLAAALLDPFLRTVTMAFVPVGLVIAAASRSSRWSHGWITMPAHLAVSLLAQGAAWIDLFQGRYSNTWRPSSAPRKR